MGIYRPYVIPQFAKTADVEPALKVMTYNVLYSNLGYDSVANVVLTYQPDLVAMQEVQPEMMSALQERLAEVYPYSLLGTVDNYGTTAVFSRFPFTDSYVLDLQAGRPAVVVKTKINGQEISFVAAHLLAYNLWWTPWKDIPADIEQKTAVQNRQAQLVLEEAKKLGGTVIVGCDCNSYETSSSVHIFDQSLDNSAREAGWFVGKNERAGTRWDTALQHIDYIWYRGRVQPIAVYKIKDDGGSDHFPVLAIFQMK
jgi:endonuclease/exonuclease/phosphatase (EEP) superfamily protein YafD